MTQDEPLDVGWQQPPPQDPETQAQEQRLADELRRIINRLVIVRADADALRQAADTARDFADRLDALPARLDDAVISEAGLAPQDHLLYSPLAGTNNPVAPPLHMERIAVDGEEHTEGSVRFGAAYEGPPGHVHGGFVAAMFDELLGRSQGSAGFTAYLTTTFRKPTPLFRELTLRAWVDRVEGRKRWIKGTCHLGGTLLTEAEGLFVAPPGGVALEYLTRSLAQHD